MYLNSIIILCKCLNTQKKERYIYIQVWTRGIGISSENITKRILIVSILLRSLHVLANYECFDLMVFNCWIQDIQRDVMYHFNFRSDILFFTILYTYSKNNKIANWHLYNQEYNIVLIFQSSSLQSSSLQKLINYKQQIIMKMHKLNAI